MASPPVQTHQQAPLQTNMGGASGPPPIPRPVNPLDNADGKGHVRDKPLVSMAGTGKDGKQSFIQGIIAGLPFIGKKDTPPPGGVPIAPPGKAGAAPVGQPVGPIPAAMTLRDMIAPAYVEIDFSHIQIGKYFYRTLVVMDYPRQVTPSWLEPLINFEKSLAISTFYYPVDTEAIMTRLKKKIAELEASLSTEYSKGKVLDPKNKVALKDAQELLDKLAEGSEKFYNLGMYIRMGSTSLKELDSITKNLISTLAAIGLTAVQTSLRMNQGFVSTMPIVSDQIYQIRNMDTTSLASTFPFVSSELTMEQGILYGVNMHNRTLVIFDRFKMPNANSVIFATSGAGKSYLVKLEALRSMMIGTTVIIIDPDGEYGRLAEAVNGSYISFSQDGHDKINPFDFLKDTTGQEGNVLRDKILSLHTFFKLIFGSLTNMETAILDRALILTYREKGITADPATWQNETPLLEDLYKILKGMAEDEAHGMADRLAKYVAGSAAGIFNERTNINLNNQFTVFNIRDLQEDLRPIAMHMTLDYIWTKVRSERKKRLLLIDEAWIMMQHDYSADFIFSIAKRARKYYLGLTVISQDVEDFLTSTRGKAVVSNSSIQILLRQSTSSVDRLQEVFNLSNGEKHFLLNSKQGEGLFFAGDAHVGLRVISSVAENRLVTSNPQELERMKQQNINLTQTDVDEGAMLFDA